MGIAVVVAVVVAGSRPPPCGRGGGGRGQQAPWPRWARPPRTAPTVKGTASPSSRATSGTGPLERGHTSPSGTQVPGSGVGRCCFPGRVPPRVVRLPRAWAQWGTAPPRRTGEPDCPPGAPWLSGLSSFPPPSPFVSPPQVPGTPQAVSRPTLPQLPPLPGSRWCSQVPCHSPDLPGCPFVLSPAVPQTSQCPLLMPCTFLYTPESPSNITAHPQTSPQPFLAIPCVPRLSPTPLLSPGYPVAPEPPSALGCPRPLSAFCYPLALIPVHSVTPLLQDPSVPPGNPMSPNSSATCYPPVPPECHQPPPHPPVPQPLGAAAPGQHTPMPLTQQRRDAHRVPRRHVPLQPGHLGVCPG